MLPFRSAAIAAAIAGAVVGSKLLFWLEDPALTLHNLHNASYLMGGKTIVGALAFGLLSVEGFKRYIGLRQSTGDLYAIPLAVGIAVGRIGCFLTGLSDNTYGTPTGLPWGVDFGDGIRRHPTQLYEVVFLLLLIPVLYRGMKLITQSSAVPRLPAAKSVPVTEAATASNGRPMTVLLPGDAFKVFMVAYMSFRLLCDFLKPYPRLLLGLGGIQWACAAVLLYYSSDVIRWLRRNSDVAKPQPALSTE